MRLRLILILAGFAAISAATAHALPASLSRIHDGDICWDPDVEFPVPCDEDGD